MIGIILLDTDFPRLLGDIGNPETFAFPVDYEKVEGATPSEVVKRRNPSLIKPFIDAARALEERGAQAITTSCGFLAVWQEEIAQSVRVPVFTSSLVQVPWAFQVAGRRGKIGVLTVDALSLTGDHFKGVGAGEVPVIVRGMDHASEFCRVYLGNHPDMDIARAKNEVVSEAVTLMCENPEVMALVLECTNMAVFGNPVRSAVSVPVFDIVTLANFVWSALSKTGAFVAGSRRADSTRQES